MAGSVALVMVDVDVVNILRDILGGGGVRYTYLNTIFGLPVDAIAVVRSTLVVTVDTLVVLGVVWVGVGFLR